MEMAGNHDANILKFCFKFWYLFLKSCTKFDHSIILILNGLIYWLIMFGWFLFNKSNLKFFFELKKDFFNKSTLKLIIVLISHLFLIIFWQLLLIYYMQIYCNFVLNFDTFSWKVVHSIILILNGLIDWLYIDYIYIILGQKFVKALLSLV